MLCICSSIRELPGIVSRVVRTSATISAIPYKVVQKSRQTSVNRKLKTVSVTDDTQSGTARFSMIRMFRQITLRESTKFGSRTWEPSPSEIRELVQRHSGLCSGQLLKISSPYTFSGSSNSRGHLKSSEKRPFQIPSATFMSCVFNITCRLSFLLEWCVLFRAF